MLRSRPHRLPPIRSSRDVADDAVQQLRGPLAIRRSLPSPRRLSQSQDVDYATASQVYPRIELSVPNAFIRHEN